MSRDCCVALPCSAIGLSGVGTGGGGGGVGGRVSAVCDCGIS